MPVNFSLRQIEYFVEAARLGTISAAAESCRTSQTGVSLAVVELERHLGVQLFVRRKAKGVALTAAGSRILAEARSLLGQAEALEMNARSEGQEVQGRLCFGSTPTLTPLVVPELLDNFCRQYPAISVSTVELSVEELRVALLAGECDLAMLFSSGQLAGIESAVIRTERPYVLLPASHRLTEGKDVSLFDLAGEPLIAPATSAGVYNSEEVIRSVGIEPTIGPRSHSLEMTRELVGRGLGFSILVQRWPSDTTYTGRKVATREIKETVPESRIQLAHAQGVQITRRIEAAIEFCRNTFGAAAENS